jgi:hypothetical protein
MVPLGWGSTGYSWVTSKTTNVDGKTTVYLTKGKSYRFTAKGTTPAGVRKTRDVYRTISYCPYPVGIWLPP